MGTLKSVTFGSNIQIIGDYAFYGCAALTEASLPEKVVKIGYASFYECGNLAKVTFPSAKFTIDGFAFTRTALTSMDFTFVMNIGEYAFAGTGLTEIIIPPLTESIGNGAFYSCSDLTSMIMVESPQPIKIDNDPVTNSNVSYLYIGRDFSAGGNFTSASIKTLVIGNGVTAVPDGAFQDCTALSELTLGSGLTSIGQSAFKGCEALTTVAIPASVTTIGASAFEGTTLNGKIAIGCGVTEIGERGLYGKSKAQSVCVAAIKAPAAGEHAFSAYDEPLYVPAESVDAYDVSPWSSFYDFADPLALKEITSVTIDGKAELNGLKPGDTFKLTAEFAPADATLPYIFWRSTNPEVATVDTDGNVTYLGLESTGECEILAETMYANGPVASAAIKGATSGIELIINNDIRENAGANVNAPAGIYNLQGIRLRRTATDDDVKALPAGIYIVNGKKVVIR